MSILSPAVEGLSHTAEVRMCRSYGERFGARLEEEKSEYSRTAKVRSMTALLAGTAIAILFI